MATTTTQGQPPRPTVTSQKELESPRTGQIVVELKQRPRYDPFNAPPPPRVTLLPPRDSTAYIIERILLPPKKVARDGNPMPKRMTYVVGWRDLPAATLLVPALDILEYVSPRELEDWEAALEEELNADRARLQEEKKKSSTQITTGKKKRGRPPAHANIEAATAAELDTDEDPKGRLMGGALSLSTPQKSRMRDFEGLSDEDEESPSRQLAQESYNNSAPLRSEDDELASGVYDKGVVDLMVIDDSAEEGIGTEEKHEDTKGVLDQLPMEGSYLASIGSSAPKGSAPTTLFATATSAKNAYNIAFTPAGIGALRPEHEELRQTSLGASSASSTNIPRAPPALISKPSKATSRSKETKTDRPKPRNKPRSKAGQKPVEVDGEEQWVIERVEDHALYEVEGKGSFRYFKVRWEGDWPPDQKTSWEPEENIPPNTVRNYFKRGKQKRKRPPSQPKQPPGVSKKKDMKQTKLSWTKQHSSVSGLFDAEDEEMDELAMQPPSHSRGYGDHAHKAQESDDDDEVFVVDVPQNAGAATSSLNRSQAQAFMGF